MYQGLVNDQIFLLPRGRGPGCVALKWRRSLGQDVFQSVKAPYLQR